MHPTHLQTVNASRVREEALDWFVRRRNEDFTPGDERSFQIWLAADAAHREAFAGWRDEWRGFDAIPLEARHLLQGNLAYDQAMAAASPGNLAGKPPVPGAPVPGVPPLRRRALVVPAFALIAVAVVGSAGLLAWDWRTQPLFSQAFSTPRGQQAELRLPDGSRLQLDTATRLEVVYYRDRREVNLFEGQALFAVQPDVARPFEVLAGATRVTVIGTRFSVRHLPGMSGDEGVHVAVEQGKVRVEPKAQPGAGPVPVYLAPGQQIYSDAAGQLAGVAAVPEAGIAPWRGGRLSFENLRLDRALAELSRYRDPQLVVRDPEVAALRLTGVFDPMDQATFQRVLPLSLPVRLKASDGLLEIIRAD
jgi:transmembrane sensor